MNSEIPRARGRPRDPEKEHAIVEAAMRLFLARGFEGTSVDAIAESAGVSKVTIYARFTDKETLFREALRRKCDAFMDSRAFELSAERDVRAGLEEIARRFLALMTDPDALALMRMMMAGHGRDVRMVELFLQHAVGVTKVTVATFFERETARGRLAVEDPEAAAWRFLGAVKGEAHMLALLGLPPKSADYIERHVSACVEDFMRAHAAAPRRP